MRVSEHSSVLKLFRIEITSLEAFLPIGLISFDTVSNEGEACYRIEVEPMQSTPELCKLLRKLPKPTIIDFGIGPIRTHFHLTRVSSVKNFMWTS